MCLRLQWCLLEQKPTHPRVGVVSFSRSIFWSLGKKNKYSQLLLANSQILKPHILPVSVRTTIACGWHWANRRLGAKNGRTLKVPSREPGNMGPTFGSWGKIIVPQKCLEVWEGRCDRSLQSMAHGVVLPTTLPEWWRLEEHAA